MAARGFDDGAELMTSPSGESAGGTLGEDAFLRSVWLCVRPDLTPIAATTRASSFGLFDKALAKCADPAHESV
jgi:hypothetical protein